ncbi:MAG: response regulator [gamma proteobacterium symbiont of Taylorina sp.]|nr:response regulator [gamma proteobacterium symbiont of Taylorina sp.]
MLNNPDISNTESNRQKDKRFLRLKGKFVITFFSIFSAAFFLVGYLGFSKINETGYKLVITKDIHALKDIAYDLQNYFVSIPKDLNFLASSYNFNKYLLWENIGEENLAFLQKRNAIDTFLSFSHSKPSYFKLRFIDAQGNEQINIKRDLMTHQPLLVADKNLQNKKNRDYFKQSINMNTKMISISDINLNKEFGQIAEPYIPIVRFSMPVIGKEEIKYGVFVISLYADQFLNRIEKIQQQLTKEKRNIYLIDNKGFYLFNKDKDKLWGKDLPHKSSLKIDQAIYFTKMQKNNEGFFEDENNLYSYRKIFPSLANKNNYWILYTVSDKNFALKDFTDYKNLSFLIIIIILCFVLFFINLYVNQITRPLAAITESFKMLALGKLPDKNIKYQNKDEILILLESMKMLASNTNDTIQQVTRIAKGDLDSRVKLLSKEDNLGIAINEMTQSLKEKDKTINYNTWLSEGLSQISNTLSAEMSYKEFADHAVSLLCRYIDAGKGVFYSVDNNSLALIGSYMHCRRDSYHHQYAIGEASIGQVAKEKKPLLLTDIEHVISLAINDIPAVNSYTFPLLYKKELFGVIELISIYHFDKKVQTYLNQSQEIIAGILYSVVQRNQVKTLLVSETASKEQLELQNKEIQEANTMMQEQQLQLTQANAQMEEDKNQLEEANTQMEEQQQQLKEQNEYLKQSKQELDQKAEALALSSQYKSEFLANMSHELRTPLNSIILLSEMLADNKQKNLKVDEIKKADIINKSGNELLRLINDVLDLSKVEAGKMELTIDFFDSTEFCHDLSAEFEQQAEQKQLELLTIDNYKNIISNDKNHLFQVIRNLLSNALKFTRQGCVTLQIDPAEAYEKGDVKISVIDTGVGIAENKQQAIFEAFQQAEGGTSREYGGTGLGLSISKEMSSLMQGELTLQSIPEKGSTFALIIPNLDSDAEQKIILPQSSSGTHAENLQDDDREILTAIDHPFLIIEDDRIFAGMLKEKIKQSNELVLIASTGEEGLQLAQTHNIKALMLDLGLPDMDGIDVLKAFKTNQNLRKIPIYVISGDKKENHVKRHGAIGFSQKPVNNEDLSQIIDQFNQFNHKKVKDLLIVEDDDYQRETLIEYIGNGSIKSTGVATLTEAITELEKQIYDAVIVDLELQKGSGYELCEYIKDHHLEIPIIIYTGKDLSGEEENRLKTYTDSIIIKTAASQKRLLEDVDLFLHRVRVNVGNNEKNSDDINLKDKKILVVDDDIRNVYVLTELLEDRDAEVLSALNGKKALEALDHNDDIDMILMDIMMPEMDGHEAARKIRQNDKIKDIPIIALTAKAMPEDKQQALDAGCNDYVIKPIKVETLIGIMDAWLKK